MSLRFKYITATRISESLADKKERLSIHVKHYALYITIIQISAYAIIPSVVMDLEGSQLTSAASHQRPAMSRFPHMWDGLIRWILLGILQLQKAQHRLKQPNLVQSSAKLDKHVLAPPISKTAHADPKAANPQVFPLCLFGSGLKLPGLQGKFEMLSETKNRRFGSIWLLCSCHISMYQ